MELHPELGLLPHPVHPKIFLELDALARQHLDVERPEHLGDEEARLAPGQGHAGTRPRPLAERVVTVPRVVRECGVPVRVVFGKPALRPVAVTVVKVAGAACEAEHAVLDLDLVYSLVLGRGGEGDATRRRTPFAM